MKKSIVWLGHNCWRYSLGQTSFLIDPYLQTSTSPCHCEDVSCDYILVSHGHADHCADVLSIAQRTGATVVAMAEVAEWFHKKGVKSIEPMNIGGIIPVSVLGGCSGPALQTASLMMTPALHSSTMPDGSPGGNACGFLLGFRRDRCNLDVMPETDIKPIREFFSENYLVYFACDTGYFSEMNMIGDLDLDVAILPIGGRYTMGPSASLTAIKALRPKRVFPSHYGTWPPINQDVERWADAVRKYTEAEPVVLTPGTIFDLE